MKKTIQWLVAALVPVLMTSPVPAQEAKTAPAEETSEAKIPTLTFYYFDG